MHEVWRTEALKRTDASMPKSRSRAWGTMRRALRLQVEPVRRRCDTPSRPNCAVAACRARSFPCSSATAPLSCSRRRKSMASMIRSISSRRSDRSTSSWERSMRPPANESGRMNGSSFGLPSVEPGVDWPAAQGPYIARGSKQRAECQASDQVALLRWRSSHPIRAVQKGIDRSIDHARHPNSYPLLTTC